MGRIESVVDTSPRVISYRAIRFARRRMWRHEHREDHVSRHFFMHHFRKSSLWSSSNQRITIVVSTDSDGRSVAAIETWAEHCRRPPGTPTRFDFGEGDRHAARLMRAVSDDTVYPPDLVAFAAQAPGGRVHETTPRWDKVGPVPLEAIRGSWTVGATGELIMYEANPLYHPEVWDDDPPVS